MLYLTLISISAILYLTTASLGVLPYALSASDFERFASKTVSFELAALALLLVVALPLFTLIRWRRALVVFWGGLILFVSLNLLIIITEARPSSSLNIFLGIVVSFMVGSLVSSIHYVHKVLLKYWPPLTAVIIFIAFAWLFLNDGIIYPQGILKPLLTGGIVSTELSNVAAIASIAMLYRRQHMTPVGYMIITALIALQLWFLATGTLIALLIVYLFLAAVEGKITFRRSRIFGVFLRVIAAIGLIYFVIIVLIEAGQIKLSWLMRYLDDSFYGRLYIYEQLIDAALSNYMTGIGVGRFYMHPHHNILGLAAQTGVVSSLIYTCFTLMALVYSFFIVKSHFLKLERYKYSTRIVIVFLGIALFLWLKGFFHDTWQDKITYFCLGFIITYNFNFFTGYSVSAIQKKIENRKSIIG